MDKKYALIVGGTKGLGRSLAREASERGLWPVITGSSVDLPYKDHIDHTEVRLNLTNVRDYTNLRVVPDLDNNVSHVFLVAGKLIEKRFQDSDFSEINQMVDVNLRGPWCVLNNLLHTIDGPFHFVTIASTSSWRLRDNQSMYCALKAAQAAFNRNLALELNRDRPGSKVTLINPGGMKTDLFKESKIDTTGFMDTVEVADLIWDKVQLQGSQTAPYREWQIIRRKDGSPKLEHGPRLPEVPEPSF